MIQPQEEGASCLKPPTAQKQLFHSGPKEKTKNKHHKAGTTNTTLSTSFHSEYRGLPGFHTHRIAEEVLQGAPLNVLSEEIQLLVLVQHTDELQHVGVIQAAHHFHLGSKDIAPQRRGWNKSRQICSGEKHSRDYRIHSNPNLKVVNCCLFIFTLCN